MNCEHEIHDLLGTADGITCRRCGKKFANFDAVVADRPKAAQPEQEKPAPKKSRKKKEAE